MVGLYKFYEDQWYGELLGFFVSDSSEVEKIMGKTVCFGEVFGKHSCVEVNISDKNVTLITQDKSLIEWCIINDIVCGYDPTSWLNDMLK